MDKKDVMESILVPLGKIVNRLSFGVKTDFKPDMDKAYEGLFMSFTDNARLKGSTDEWKVFASLNTKYFKDTIATAIKKRSKEIWSDLPEIRRNKHLHIYVLTVSFMVTLAYLSGIVVEVYNLTANPTTYDTLFNRVKVEPYFSFVDLFLSDKFMDNIKKGKGFVISSADDYALIRKYLKRLSNYLS